MYVCTNSPENPKRKPLDIFCSKNRILFLGNMINIIFSTKELKTIFTYFTILFIHFEYTIVIILIKYKH